MQNTLSDNITEIKFSINKIGTELVEKLPVDISNKIRMELMLIKLKLSPINELIEKIENNQ